MSEKKKVPYQLDDKELERRIRSERKFSLAEAIGRNAGSELMKGASPVTRKRQAELVVEHCLESYLIDAEGALEVVLLRHTSESATLLDMSYEQPLVALGLVIEQILDSETLLHSFVADVDRQWGRMNCERPYFQQEGQPPDQDDPYTYSSVRIKLTRLVEKLRGDAPSS